MSTCCKLVLVSRCTDECSQLHLRFILVAVTEDCLVRDIGLVVVTIPHALKVLQPRGLPVDVYHTLRDGSFTASTMIVEDAVTVGYLVGNPGDQPDTSLVSSSHTVRAVFAHFVGEPLYKVCAVVVDDAVLVIAVSNHRNVPCVWLVEIHCVLQHAIKVVVMAKVLFEFTVRPPWVVLPLHTVKVIPVYQDDSVLIYRFVQMFFQQLAVTEYGVNVYVG